MNIKGLLLFHLSLLWLYKSFNSISQTRCEQLINTWTAYKQRFGLIFQMMIKYCKTHNKKKRSYMRLINTSRQRLSEVTLVKDMRRLDVQQHYHYFRMSPWLFDILLNLIKHKITHKNNHRLPISPALRLAITLRILATGDSQQTVAFSYRLGKSTVNKILTETCEAIYSVLQPIYLAPPTEDEWKTIAKGKYLNHG